MKILELGKTFIRKTTQILQDKICNYSTKRKYLPPEIQIRPQPLSDIFDGQINLRYLQRGEAINEGRSAVVYDILDHPDLVARIKFGRRFKPEKLSFKNADPNRHIIAGTDDFGVTIMNKLKGYPLHGKHWQIMEDPQFHIYFPQLEAIKAIPDEAFIKYYEDILKLRQMGYDFDTKNPNNILYDANKKIFNLVDIEPPIKGLKPEVTIEDFYPFIDGARLRHYYSICTDPTRKLIQQEARTFLDRIADIGERIGVNLKMKDFDPDNPIPPFLTCLYHNKKLRLYQMN